MRKYILDAFFRFYLFIYTYELRYNTTESYRNSVYDSLGVIDTLGNHGDNGRFTWSYSDEFVSVFAIRLPFGYSLQYITCEEKNLYFCKGELKKCLI